MAASDSDNYRFRWVTKEFTAQEIAQLLIDRVALLESRVNELEVILRELRGDAA